MSEHDQAHSDQAMAAADTKLTITVLAVVLTLLAVWVGAIATFGFSAFIYVMWAMVAAAFVFTLTLTRP